MDYVSSGARNSAQLTDGRYYTFGMQDRPAPTPSSSTPMSKAAFRRAPCSTPFWPAWTIGTIPAASPAPGAPTARWISSTPSTPTPPRGTASNRWTARAKVYQTGLYAQDQLRYGRWILTLGGRYDWATNESDYLSDASSKVNSEALHRPRRTDLSFRQRHRAVRQLLHVVPARLGHTGTPARDGGNFDPTKGKQYEVGIKYQPTGSDSMITASLFQLTQQNVTTADPVYSAIRCRTAVRSRRAGVGSQDLAWLLA